MRVIWGLAVVIACVPESRRRCKDVVVYTIHFTVQYLKWLHATRFGSSRVHDAFELRNSVHSRKTRSYR